MPLNTVPKPNITAAFHTPYLKNPMKFEWNDDKDRSNQKKHGISFSEASTVFSDPLQISQLDYRFSYGEERWITIGSTSKGRIVVVANVFFSEGSIEIIRIISARPANHQEIKHYENP